MNLLRRGGNSNKIDFRTRRKGLDWRANNLIILQQDALFFLHSHDKFFYQKSYIRICQCCECLNPPLHEPAYHHGACTNFGASMKGLIAKRAEFISQCITNEQLINRAYTDFLIKTSLTLDQKAQISPDFIW